MSRKLSFVIEGPVDVLVMIEEDDFNGDGISDLRFTATVDESGGKTADLRGLFWDTGDESKIAGLSVYSPLSADVTDSRFAINKVVDLGGGANMQGSITAGGRGFDAGVEIGTQGIGADDLQTTTFVLTGGSSALTLDDVGGQRFGARLTSVGAIGGARQDSLKLSVIAPHAPDAIDDVLAIDEDTAGSLNLLNNDSDGDGDPLTVVSIEGGTVGTQFAVTSDGGREALVTVNSNGTFSVDPDGNFEDLSTGDTDTFTLSYTISDGNGGEDWAEVNVTIAGVNDAPVANNDGFVFVESADVVTVDVLANDTDVDGTLAPATLTFQNVDNGNAANVAGQMQYTAANIGGDTIDNSVADTVNYTVEDNEGLLSNPGTVGVRVIDPLVETHTDSRAAANGQLLTLSLSTEDRTYNTSSFFNVDITAGALDQPDINVSFVIDESGSISPTSFQQERAAVQNTINLLRAEFAGTGTDVQVQIVEFASGAGSASYDLFDPVLDNVATGTPLASQSGGNTNYEAALQQAVGFFTGNPGENFMLFVSDGQPTTGGGFTDEVAQLQTLGVSRTAVGFGGGINTGTLNQIDNTGGSQVFANASQLGDAFAASPLFPADLFDFKLEVNGTVVANKTNLISLGGGDYELDSTILNLLNNLADTNTVTATARFDTDSDGNADEVRTAQTIINGTDGSDILFA